MAYSFSANTKIWDSRRFLAEIRTVSWAEANQKPFKNIQKSRPNKLNPCLDASSKKTMTLVLRLWVWTDS